MTLQVNLLLCWYGNADRCIVSAAPAFVWDAFPAPPPEAETCM